MPKIISLHDVLEPLKQALLKSRAVKNSSQICGSNLLQKVFTLGDGCWLPKGGPGSVRLQFGGGTVRAPDLPFLAFF